MSYYHTDALGSPVAKTNASKSVIGTSEYEPYGNCSTVPMTTARGIPDM